MAGWLLLTLLMCLHNQISSFIHSIHSIITYKEYRCLKNVIHQIDSKNEWLLLPPKFGLVFVLTLENAFSWRFHFKANRKSIGSSTKRYQGFQNSPPFERSACFYETISEHFKRFQWFIFLESENLFQKTGVPLLC